MAQADMTVKSKTTSGWANGAYLVGVGGLGGISAALVKFMGQHMEKVTTLIEGGDSHKAMPIIEAYGAVAFILFCIGGIIGWASREPDRFKLLALGASAPALVTTWFSGAQPNMPIAPADTQSLKSAHAALIGLKPFNFAGFNVIRVNDNAEPGFYDGLKEVFGQNAIQPRYWVIVASEPSLDSARELRDALNASDPSLGAFIGKQRPGNELYPVIVGKFAEYNNAAALQARVAGMKGLNDVYLSDFPDRLPAVE